eukprot:4680876-Pyramimonas_sp.AAC.1
MSRNLQIPKDVADALHKLQGVSLDTKTLTDLLYDGPFQALGETLLSDPTVLRICVDINTSYVLSVGCPRTVVAVDWLSCFPQAAAASVFYDFFDHAPADCALPMMASTLSSRHDLSSVIARKTACGLLLRLFCADDSSGLEGLIQALEAKGGLASEVGTRAHAQQEVPSMRAHLVRILVSLPDRAGAEAPAELHPSVFAANLSRQLLLLTSRWHLVSPPTSHLLCSYSHPGGA